MIEITQTGQAGKTSYLIDMHRMRARIFKDRMGWDVDVNQLGMEIDDFDIPEAIYFLVLNDRKQVIGSWRFLPTSGPTMIRRLWPETLESLPMPSSDNVWEATRFGIDISETDAKSYVRQVNNTTAELVCALVETCVLFNIEYVYSLYDRKIGRLLRKLGCETDASSDEFPVDDLICQIVRYKTDDQLLEKVKQATGIKDSLVSDLEFPQGLLSRLPEHQRNFYQRKEAT